jgi:hypothetical protein
MIPKRNSNWAEIDVSPVFYFKNLTITGELEWGRKNAEKSQKKFSSLQTLRKFYVRKLSGSIRCNKLSTVHNFILLG